MHGQNHIKAVKYICNKVEFLRLNSGEGLILRLFCLVSVFILIIPLYYIISNTNEVF